MESKVHISEFPTLLRIRLRCALAVCCLLTSVVFAQDKVPASTTTLSDVTEAFSKGDFPKGLQLAQAIVQSHPEDPRAWTLMGIALSQLHRNAESMKAFHKALEVRPDFVPALEGAAQLEYNTGQPDARALLDRLVRLNPHEPTAHAMLGALAFKSKDCGSAVANFKESWQVINSRPEALAEYGVCLVRTGQTADSIHVFGRIAELQPGDWHARYNLAVVQLQANHPEEAIQTIRPLTEGPTPSVDSLNLVASAYEANQQTPLAVAALQQGIKLAPRDLSNYLDLATISLDHGSFQVGVDVLNAAIKAIPDSAALYLERGVLLVQVGKYDEADADFEKARTLSPQQNMSTVALGISLLQRNDIGQSLQVVQTRLQQSPHDPILNYLLAETLLRKGARPGTPEYHEAVSAARRSIDIKPDFVLAHDVLSELYLRSKMTSQAVEQSQLALKFDPNDQAAIYHLISAYRESGRNSEIPPLAKRMSEITTSARDREAEINRFKLVERGAQEIPDSTLRPQSN